jgi:hypothetical protein
MFGELGFLFFWLNRKKNFLRKKYILAFEKKMAGKNR